MRAVVAGRPASSIFSCRISNNGRYYSTEKEAAENSISLSLFGASVLDASQESSASEIVQLVTQLVL